MHHQVSTSCAIKEVAAQGYHCCELVNCRSGCNAAASCKTMSQQNQTGLCCEGNAVARKFHARTCQRECGTCVRLGLALSYPIASSNGTTTILHNSLNIDCKRDDGLCSSQYQGGQEAPCWYHFAQPSSLTLSPPQVSSLDLLILLSASLTFTIGTLLLALFRASSTARSLFSCSSTPPDELDTLKLNESA